MNALDANLKAQSENKGSRVEIGSDVDDTKVNVVKVERAVSDEQIGSESLELTKSHTVKLPKTLSPKASANRDENASTPSLKVEKAERAVSDRQVESESTDLTRSQW